MKAEKAVPFTRSNPRRPERDQYPEDEKNDRPKPPTTCGNEQPHTKHGFSFHYALSSTTLEAALHWPPDE